MHHSPPYVPRGVLILPSPPERKAKRRYVRTAAPSMAQPSSGAQHSQQAAAGAGQVGGSEDMHDDAPDWAGDDDGGDRPDSPPPMFVLNSRQEPIDQLQPDGPAPHTAAWVGSRAIPGAGAQRAAELRGQQRQLLRANYFSTWEAREAVASSLTDAVQQVYVDAIDKALQTCPQCGATGRCRSAGWSRRVIVVSIERRTPLDVPAAACKACGHQYSVLPLELGCLPATAVTGWDLLKAGGEQQVVWYSLALLAFADREVTIMRRWSVKRFVDVLQAHHAIAGSRAPLSDDMLRRTLATALLVRRRLVLAGTHTTAIAWPLLFSRWCHGCMCGTALTCMLPLPCTLCAGVRLPASMAGRLACAGCQRLPSRSHGALRRVLEAPALGVHRRLLQAGTPQGSGRRRHAAAKQALHRAGRDDALLPQQRGRGC